jgi:Tol biopolymer transport system component
MQKKLTFQYAATVFVVLLTMCKAVTPTRNPVQLFNLGRNDVYAGYCFSQDQQTLYFTTLYKPDSLSPYQFKIHISTWSPLGWAEPQLLNLIEGGEFYPALSPDEDILYFSSTALLPGMGKGGDMNIWCSRKSKGKWQQAAPVSTLNSAKNERITHIDDQGNLYITSDRTGNFDVFYATVNNGKYTVPQAIDEWNTALEEEYVAVYPNFGIALLQRSEAGVKTELFYALLKGEKWSSPSRLSYEGELTQVPYARIQPKLSADGSCFYTVLSMKIWQQAMADIVQQNAIQLPKKLATYQPLAVAKRKFGEPEIFHGSTLQTNNGLSFTQDQQTLYLSRYTLDKDSTGNAFIKIFESHWKNGAWTTPQPVSFNNPSAPFEYHPVLSPDGKRLFYNSCAAEPGSSLKYHSNNNIWYVDKLPDNTWSKPVMIDALATNAYDDYVSVTRSGDLYFRSDRPGGRGGGDIYLSQYHNGQYQKPTPVETLNSADDENDLCVDPDERFLIFNRYINSNGEIQLYISRKVGETWSSPKLLTRIEKRENWELTPTLSPDGKYFYYEVNSNICRVEMAALFK